MERNWNAKRYYRRIWVLDIDEQYQISNTVKEKATESVKKLNIEDKDDDVPVVEAKSDAVEEEIKVQEVKKPKTVDKEELKSVNGIDIASVEQ